VSRNQVFPGQYSRPSVDGSPEPKPNHAELAAGLFMIGYDLTDACSPQVFR